MFWTIRISSLDTQSGQRLTITRWVIILDVSVFEFSRFCDDELSICMHCMYIRILYMPHIHDHIEKSRPTSWPGRVHTTKLRIMWSLMQQDSRFPRDRACLRLKFHVMIWLVKSTLHQLYAAHITIITIKMWWWWWYVNR